MITIKSSEINMINQKILDAIKEKDCFSLLFRLSMYTELPKDLAMIDDNTGKTLQQLIEESTINFRHTIPRGI